MQLCHWSLYMEAGRAALTPRLACLQDTFATARIPTAKKEPAEVSFPGHEDAAEFHLKPKSRPL